MAVGKDLN